MTIHLQRDMEFLDKQLLLLSSMVEEATNKSILALVDRRPEIAREVIRDDDDIDQSDAIVNAVDELMREAPGDILVFLSGEREIRDTQDALSKQHYRNTEIVPLYARLSAAEQNRIFQSHSGRRIVLATNVAETSLTVPGIIRH